MFDPCGTRKLEGDEILKRLAAYLGVSETDLEMALKFQADLSQAARESKKN